MKTLKTCLVILCLLHVRAVGLPRFSGANFFMKEIKLTRGQVAFVDDEDYEYLNQFKWCLHKSKASTKIYAQRRLDKATIMFMHRQIIDCKPGYFIDHKDRNGLNNQKNNLRICTKMQNAFNTSGHRDSYSKYKGVYFDKTRNKWAASIKVSGSRIMRRFDDEIEAAKFYNIKALELHKEFAYLNNIPCVV